MVYTVAGDLHMTQEYANMDLPAVEALAPVALPTEEEPTAAVRGRRGRGRGRGCCRGRRRCGGAAAAPGADPQPAAAGPQQAVWGAVNEILPFTVPGFSGTPGPTRADEHSLSQNPEKQADAHKSKLFYFE
eukprot:1186416-Rhodomonas_salina.1